MARELFGTDGVRGKAGEYPLDSEGAMAIGSAVGQLFCQPGDQVLIGCDPRESSAGLVSSLTAGLIRQGVSVLSVGIITTPGLAYLTRESKVAAGVMVTASHNPFNYNGVKVFDGTGGKLSDDTEHQLNDLIESGVAPAEQPGSSALDESLIKHYEDFLVSSSEGLQLHGLKLAVDMANGSASGLAQRVFERLGAQVTPLFDQPDGRNINDHCGATDVTELERVVSAQACDLGVAFDGDADRLIMVDGQGRAVKGDYLLYLLAVTGHTKGVVATVMSNLGFEQALLKQGIAVERTAVGDRYVLEGLEKTGYELGGEQSGHIVLPRLLQTGDGILAAVQVLKALQGSDKSLAQWCDEVPLLPQALVNIELTDRQLLDKPEIQQYIEQQTQQLAGRGRLLIRPSGTEPLARVMVEAPQAEAEAQRISSELAERLKGAA